MVRFRQATKEDLPRIMKIWRGAVDATHEFLSAHDRLAIEAEVRMLFPTLKLLLAVGESSEAEGFMVLQDGHLEALFVAADQQGRGIGKAFVDLALSDNPKLTVDVNAQNAKALSFYERLGFEHIGRSTHDGQGRPYPLIHLRYRSKA